MVRSGAVLALCGGGAPTDFVASYRQGIQEAVERRELAREPMWTESIAVGDETFVRGVGEQTRNRMALETEQAPSDVWTVREAGEAYGHFSGQESEPKA